MIETLIVLDFPIFFGPSTSQRVGTACQLPVTGGKTTYFACLAWGILHKQGPCEVVMLRRQAHHFEKTKLPKTLFGYLYFTVICE